MEFSVIIATSLKRTDWLINRSLLSVYNQVGVDKSKWAVIVVDDNKDTSELYQIQKRINHLRGKLKLTKTDFPTRVIRNNRIPHMSGTGAWNTGIIHAHNLFPEGYISILDDDDEYLPNHLCECISALKTGTVAVFQRLIWLNNDKSKMHIDLTEEGLTAENFFIGNPGVQGSNMFFKTKNLIDIDGFDETLPNTTDRDLMIRFLWKNDIENIEVIERIGVIHHNHSRYKVNNNLKRKQHGLDLFYGKFKGFFSDEAYINSLARAKTYFNYSAAEQIVICMPLKNAEKTVERSILSVVNQKKTKRDIVLLIGNDNSTDSSEKIVNEIASKYQNVFLLNVNFNKVYLTRNYLNDYVRKNYPNCILIGRLDSDDLLYEENTLQKIENLYDEKNFDVLICGNKQIKNGKVLEWVNRPSKKLLQEHFLLSQLFKMYSGELRAELPSCNTFIKPSVKINYPNRESAEDHWFTVFLLQNKYKLNIEIDEKLIYSVYSLDGETSNRNKKAISYNQSRKELYEYYKK